MHSAPWRHFTADKRQNLEAFVTDTSGTLWCLHFLVGQLLDGILPVQYSVLATVAMTTLVKPVPAPSSRTVAPLKTCGLERMKSAKRNAPSHTWGGQRDTTLHQQLHRHPHQPAVLWRQRYQTSGSSSGVRAGHGHCETSPSLAQCDDTLKNPTAASSVFSFI